VGKRHYKSGRHLAAAGSAPEGRQEAVAAGDNKSCKGLEKRVVLLAEENERMVKRAARIEKDYTRLKQKFEALTGD
jgi:hypothetical protein